MFDARPLRYRGQLDIRRLGWIEVANILLFALLLGLAHRVG